MDFNPELLKEARTLAGLTLAQLAERAGISLGQVVRFENGLRPSPASWEKLLAALRSALADRVKAAERMRKRLAS